MTEHDYDKDGPAIVVILITVAAIVLLGLSIIKTEGNNEEVKVVANYKDCEIVRWTDPSSRYQYFLHCPNKKGEL